MTESFKNIMKWLNENQWLNLIFLVLAVLSIIVSFYLYFKSKRRKIPIYLIKTFNLIRDRVNKIQEVKIIYSDKPIKNLSITKIAFWNRGNEVINKSDIAPKEPIRIIVGDEYEILNASIIFTKNEANNFSIVISPDKKSVVIDFDYMFTAEGISLEIYHTGVSGKDIKFKGSLKDVPQFATANFNKDFMLDYVFDNSFGLMREKLSDRGWKIYMICILPFLVPVMFVVLPIQTFYGLTKRTSVPTEFSLEDEE